MFKPKKKPGINYTERQIPHADCKGKVPMKADETRTSVPLSPGGGYTELSKNMKTPKRPPIRPAR